METENYLEVPDTISDKRRISTKNTNTDFDPSLSPYHFTNRKAARVRGLKYDQITRRYYDSYGRPVRDYRGELLPLL